MTLLVLLLLRHAEAAATIASPCSPAPGPCLLEPKTWGAGVGSSDWGFSGVSGASAGAGAALLLSMALVAAAIALRGRVYARRASTAIDQPPATELTLLPFSQGLSMLGLAAQLGAAAAAAPGEARAAAEAPLQAERPHGHQATTTQYQLFPPE